MKRNLLTAVAIMVAATFIALPVAEAVDVKMGGEFLTRWEVRNQDWDNDSDVTDFTGQRTRLNANVNMDDRTSAFIQLQSNRIWGRAGSTTGPTNQQAHGALGSGPAAGTGTGAPNDTDASVGIHQAYFTLNKFFDLPIDLQVGRQELVLDGHRLIGNTFWTFGASTHDAVRVTHNEGNHTLMYMYSMDIEAADFQDDDDKEIHIFYGQLRKILGGALSFTYVLIDDDTANTPGFFTAPGTGLTAVGTGSIIGASNTFTDTADVDNSIHTLGMRQAGTLKQFWDIIYRLEVYGQFGDAACGAGTVSTVCGGTTFTDADREAFMIGARIGKKFNNVMWKPKVTIWYDYLSGDDDATDDTHNAFNTVIDTGHKYYGLQDVFLGVGGSGGSGGQVAGTAFLGLQDLALKINTNPFKKGGVNLDVHTFWTAENANRTGGDQTVQGKVSAGEKYLGNEIDLTAYYWYNPYLKITAGYSHFFASDLLASVQGRKVTTTTGAPDEQTILTGDNDQDWAYIMMNMQF